MSSPAAAELDMHARRALDFFQHQTALQLDKPFSIDLCSQWLSRLMHHEPAIKHGVIAVASLHENFMRPSGAEAKEERKILALHHYGKSINEVVQLNKKASESASTTTLITCLLYCLAESLQGHLHSSWKHIVAGIQLLAEVEAASFDHEKANIGMPQPLLNLLRRILMNLGTQAMALQDGPTDSMAMQFIKTSHQTVSEVFISTDQALAELSHLVNDTLRAVTWYVTHKVDMDRPDEDLLLVREALEERYSTWAVAFNTLLVAINGDSTTEAGGDWNTAPFILRVNQVLCRIIMSGLYSASETAYDAYLEDFQTIVQSTKHIIAIERQQGQGPRKSSDCSTPPLMSSPPIFSMTLGILPALFFVCTSCRHQETRHEALQILRENKRRETCWDSDVLSRVAERHITLEEQKMMDYWRERQAQVDQCLTSNSVSQSENGKCIDTTQLPGNMRIDTMVVDFTAEKSVVMSFRQTQSGERHDMVMEWTD